MGRLTSKVYFVLYKDLVFQDIGAVIWHLLFFFCSLHLIMIKIELNYGKRKKEEQEIYKLIIN